MAVQTTHQTRWTRQSRRELTIGLFFASPWIIGFICFTVVPLISSLYYSFTRYDLIGEPVWIGLNNYINLLTNDSDFRVVVYNTLWWVFISAPMGVIAAFLMALLLNTSVIVRSGFRAIFFFPSIVPAVVIAFTWNFLLNIQYGAINAVIRSLGMPTIPFLSSPELVKPSLVMIHIWTQGAAMVIFLATLQDVPRMLYEAATVDGANAWHRLWNVTIPMVSPVILFNLVISFIYGFQTFTLPWLMTRGGPGKATEFYAIFLYRNAIVYLQMGKASALSWILFIVILLFTAVLFRASGRFVYYAGGR